MTDAIDTPTGTTIPNSSPNSDPGAPAPAFYETFKNEALKTSPSVQKYKDPEALADAYVNLERRYGIEPERRLDLPKDPEDKDGWKAVWTRLGAPDTPEGYEFKAAEGSSDGDKALIDSFAKHAAEHHIPKPMAVAQMQWFMDQVAAATKAQTEQAEAARAEGEATLRREWGQAYDARSREIGRLLTETKDPQLIEALDGKLGNYPGLARFLGRMLDKMAEPGAAGGPSGAGAEEGRALTPAQATAEARKLDAHPALTNKSHPEHKAIVQRRSDLLRMASPAS